MQQCTSPHSKIDLTRRRFAENFQAKRILYLGKLDALFEVDRFARFFISFESISNFFMCSFPFDEPLSAT